jgi:hypothetical protein
MMVLLWLASLAVLTTVTLSGILGSDTRFKRKQIYPGAPEMSVARMPFGDCSVAVQGKVGRGGVMKQDSKAG